MMDKGEGKEHHNMMQHLTAMKRRGKLRGKSSSHTEAQTKSMKKAKGRSKQ